MYTQWSSTQLEKGMDLSHSNEVDETVGWHHRLNGHGFEWTSGVDDVQGGLALGLQRI